MANKKSPIDNFFYGIYNYYPKKAGQAYELLVNAALKLISENSTVKYNQFIKGTYSDQVYQLDGVQDEKVMIETKDYTIRQEKVGRDDLQKQEGGLADLPYESGIFASATGYTTPAEGYAESTYRNPSTKPIDLYDIRPSTEKDEEGRIKSVIITIKAFDLAFESAKFRVFLGPQAPEIKDGVPTDKIYNEDGSTYTTIAEWSTNLSRNFDVRNPVDTVEGVDFKNKYIIYGEQKVKIEGIQYSIPVVTYTMECRIEAEGKACLLVKQHGGGVDKLLTDLDLRSINFQDGEVVTDKVPDIP